VDPRASCDVFISYSQKDDALALKFAQALQTRGLSVWWDRQIPVGSTWDASIGTRLDAARCVTVLWSRASVASKWVRSEATKAEHRGVLFPILVERVDLPVPFNLTQTADLVGWAGDDDPRLGAIAHAVAEVVGGRTPGPMPSHEPSQTDHRARWWTSSRPARRNAMVAGALALLIAAAAWLWPFGAPDALKTAEAVRTVTSRLEQYAQQSRTGRGGRADLLEIEAILDRALAGDPDSNQLRKLKADLYRVSGDDEKAVAYITQAIADIPRDSLLYAELGFIHQRKARYAQAIDAYRTSIAVKSDLTAVAVAYSNLAAIYITREEFDEAKKCFRAGLALGPNRDQLCGDLRDVVQTREAFSDMADLLNEQCSGRGAS
jgi:Flp pilus assembly protein TadD